MDAHLNQKVTLILNIIVIAATALLLFHTTQFSFGLLILSCMYIAVVVIRDFIVKIDLHEKAGICFLYFQLGVALAVCIWSESFFAQTYLLILIGEFTFHQSKKQSLLFVFVSYTSTLLGIMSYRDFPPFEEIYLIFPRFVEFLAIFGMSLLAKIAFQQKQVLAASNEQLQAAALELEQKAALQERTRISRDIHDSVGHTLTSALTGLQTASHAIDKSNYTIAKEMLDRTTEHIRNGLNEVRSSVYVLRDSLPDRPFKAELLKLIEETSRQTGVEIKYDIDHSIPNVTPTIELTIYRALQEGLTNGIRHGSSTFFDFSLKVQPGSIQFLLTDNGHSPSQLIYGFGLNAMKERVKEAGGRLSITNKASTNGVTLEITFPIQSNPLERSEQHIG